MLRIITIVAYSQDRQALQLSHDDGTADQFVTDAPRVDAEDPEQVMQAYLALVDAAPGLPPEWTNATLVDQLPNDSKPRIVTSLRAC